MKRLFCSVFVTLLFSFSALAQNEGINFQGVARNAAGDVLVSQKINLRLSILLGSETGAVAYMETRQTTTNPQGVFAVVVGDDKALTKSINFSFINWTPAPKFIKVEMDPNAGNNYLVMGTSRLQAVPFAFHAYGVDASNVKGVLPLSSGGTGVASMTDLKTSLGLDNFNNAALETKVDKVAGKGLSTNDYTTVEKNKLAAVSGTNTGDQDLSGYATTAQLATKANASDVTTSLALKEDISNKSNAALGTSTTFYPTQNAVKTYVDAQILTATIADADATTRGKIQLAGDLTGSATSPAIASGAVTSTKIADATIVNADIATNAAIVDAKLATIATAGKVSNSATTATSVNTNSAIVARDASGNFNAGTITLSTLTASKPVFTDANKQLTSTGTLGVSEGGTGVTATPTNGQILVGNGSGFTLATLSVGTGVSITNGAGAITINASARSWTDQPVSVSANQTTFTLTYAPTASSKIWMFINGVRTDNNAYSFSGTTVTYVPANNGGYAITVSDRVQFDYTY